MDNHVLIREANPQELLRWDDLVTRFDNYRVVHKLAWMRSLENCVKGRPLYLIFEKGGEVVGCLPGFLVNVGPLRLFGSPLPGWQTLSMGPVFDERRLSTREMLPALVTFLEQRHGVHHIELLVGGLDHQVMESMGFQIKPSPTYRAQMYPGDEARTMKALKDSARRNVRRAEKLGLVVKFEEDESFVDEHYDQLEEVYTRGGNIIPFDKKRALEFFRQMKAGGNLLAVSVHLPDGGPCIATGTFTVEGKELLLWMWAHRTEHRWYRPTELMTWTVMRKAMEAGCETLDFMGRGDFKAKFGAELESNKYRWVRSRYKWLYHFRLAAEKSYRWQQSFRGRIVREGLGGLRAGSAKHVSQQSP
jgi:CelD/BcsL family acetyltransferase involved in cellulose biosynthesis